MRELLSRYFYFIIFCFFAFNVLGQSVSELKKQRLRAAEDIENTNRLLSEKGNSRKSLLSNVTLLSNQIIARQNLITNVQFEVSGLDSILAINEAKLASLNKDLGYSKKNYEDLIVHTYIHRSKYDELMFIFGSENISVAYKRYKILKDFSSRIKKQGEHLITLSDEQKRLTDEIRGNLAQKQDVLETLDRSARSLAKEKITKEVLIKDLEKEEDWLVKELKKKEKIANSLDEQIRVSIEAEAKKMAKTHNKAYIPSEFGNAKGHLSWPVEGGMVTSYFGEHEHPVLKSLKVKNNGIDIEVSKGSSVQSVFLGVVSKVIAIPGYNMAVLIRHGNYLTVYANLSKVNVSSGDKVIAGASIGSLFSDSDDARSTLHFEIWKESEKIDPILWLKK